MSPEIFLYIIVFLYGIVIGSFLNVCIYRLPEKENIVVVRSHCMNCGYQLRWYDLIPVFSYIGLKGRCRNCGKSISIQYPAVEMINGILYMLVFHYYGISIDTVLISLLFSTLIVISVIDFRTYEIPVGLNIFIAALGAVRMITDYTNWPEYLLGLFSVSLFLYVLNILTGGRAIGGGDIKLMAASGLLLGWQCNIIAFILGCIIGSVIHLARMRITKASHVLALGPYLSAGIFIAGLWGEQLIDWYIGLLGI